MEMAKRPFGQNIVPIITPIKKKIRIIIKNNKYYVGSHLALIYFLKPYLLTFL